MPDQNTPINEQSEIDSASDDKETTEKKTTFKSRISKNLSNAIKWIQSTRPYKTTHNVFFPSAEQPDYNIAGLSAMGIIGFISGIFIFFINSNDDKSNKHILFHEIIYNPQTLTDIIIAKPIDSLKKDINKFDSLIYEYKKEKYKDNTAIKADSVNKYTNLRGTEERILKRLEIYKNYCEDRPIIDSTGFDSLNLVLHFYISPETINSWDNIYPKKPLPWNFSYVKYTFKDASTSFRDSADAEFSAVKARSNIAFVTKYPAVAVWQLLILIFCSFCFIAVPTAIYLWKKVKEITDLKQDKSISYLWITVWTAFALAIPILCWENTLYDEDIIKDIFFMRHLTMVMRIIMIIGAFAGSWCLSGFVYTASLLNFFSKPLVEARSMVKEQQSSMTPLLPRDPNAQQNQAAPSADEAKELQLQKAKEAELSKQFNKLTSVFQSFFIMASIILSIMVLCTGALFTAVNSLDFIKLLTSDWGYSPARSDFVYLYGALYTVILLLVYIPAKIKFTEVDVWKDSGKSDEDFSWKDFIKNPFASFKGALVATSPLIASIVQSLIDTFFK